MSTQLRPLPRTIPPTEPQLPARAEDGPPSFCPRCLQAGLLRPVRYLLPDDRPVEDSGAIAPCQFDGGAADMFRVARRFFVYTFLTVVGVVGLLVYRSPPVVGFVLLLTAIAGASGVALFLRNEGRKRASEIALYNNEMRRLSRLYYCEACKGTFEVR